MSFKYEILKKLVRLIGLKHMFSGTKEELIAKARKKNAKKKIPGLKDEDFKFETIEINDSKVLVMKHKRKTEKACMFIIGGGMISAPSAMNIKRALKYAKDCGRDLYVPYYPLCTDHPLNVAYEMIYALYLEMLKEYEAKDISIFGSSSGGNLALGLCTYMNAEHIETQRPEKIIALSPGTCVLDDEEWQRMLEINDKDVAIDASYMKTAIDVMKCGSDDVPDYMIWQQKADYSDFPKVYINYGSDECLYACWKNLKKAFDHYGVDYDLKVGEGMYHCYPILPFVKEAEDGYKWLISASR